MTPQERQLIDDLFDRLGKLENAPRDAEAMSAIMQGLRNAPNAVYALVQTALVQDEALKRADMRIQELEAAAAAPGVVGGWLLAGSIRSRMGGGGNHQAFGDTASRSGGVEDRRPWGDQSGGDLARDAGINDIGSSSRRADNNDNDSGSRQG